MEGGVQFEEQEVAPTTTLRSRAISSMAAFVVRRGWAKDDTSAQVFLLAIAVAALALSFIVWMLLVTREEPPQVDPDVPSTFQ